MADLAGEAANSEPAALEEGAEMSVSVVSVAVEEPEPAAERSAGMATTLESYSRAAAEQDSAERSSCATGFWLLGVVSPSQGTPQPAGWREPAPRIKRTAKERAALSSSTLVR